MYSVSSWSSGKDSCLAYYKAVKSGHKVKCLLNFISREYKRCSFHGTEAGLIELQASLIGVPLVQKEVTADMKMYEQEFKNAVKGISGVEAMIFGDIYLLDHQSWVDRVCGELGIKPVEPLWNLAPESIIEEFVDAGFKAAIVSCQAEKMGKEFIGRIIDKPLIKELKKINVCPCGENGEYHTLVVDGPIFKRPIKILKSEPILRDGFWKHWFLDIKEYK